MNMQLNADLEGEKYLLDTSNYINYMVDDYNKDLASVLEGLNIIKQMPKETLRWEGILNIQVARVNSEEFVRKSLKALYWQKVYKRSNIEHFLSERDQETWKNAFKSENLTKADYVELPEFDYETVRCTVTSWYESSETFFIDRVDSVFETLSRGHLTNHPNGFNRKMVFSYWAEQHYLNSEYGNVRSASHKKIHDLRSIIMVVHGLPIPDYGSTYDLMRKLPYKTKNNFDHGLWEMQIFKNGNTHIWIEPETAVLLNSFLAKKYPNTLSTRDMPVKRKAKEYSYATAGISSDLRTLLNAILLGSNSPKAIDRETNSEFEKYFGLPVLDFMQLDPIKRKTAVDSVLKTGLPCVKAYQFYPTPSVILDEIKAHIGEVAEEQKFLEPSAGSGAIAQLYPSNFTCFEIYKPFVDLLSAKGLNALEVDFLKRDGLYEYDKVILNPPYSKNRCLMHFEHSFNFIKNDGEVYIVAPSGLKNKLEAIASKFDRNFIELKKFNSCFEDTDIKTSLFLAA